MPTQKQQNTIREMASKKLLNGEQKKVLYKLFEQKISTKFNFVRDKFAKAKVLLKEQELEAGLNNADIKKQIATIKQSNASIEKAKNAISKQGYSFDYHQKLSVSYAGTPKIKKFEAEEDKTLSKINDLRMKLLADIHGLPMTYEEMTEYIESELEKIINE